MLYGDFPCNLLRYINVSSESTVGLEVCLLGIFFLKHVVRASRVINPFCGQGTILAVANYFGMPALGNWIK
jgi:hypothetical protein